MSLLSKCSCMREEGGRAQAFGFITKRLGGYWRLTDRIPEVNCSRIRSDWSVAFYRRSGSIGRGTRSNDV